MPTAAVLHVGKLLVAERGTHIDHGPINFGRMSTVVTGKSESGNFLGRIVLNEKVETTIELNRLRQTWYRGNMDAFIKASKEDPFFFAWRPQTWSNDVGYCAMMNDPKPVIDFATQTMAISLQMTGVSGQP